MEFQLLEGLPKIHCDDRYISLYEPGKSYIHLMHNHFYYSKKFALQRDNCKCQICYRQIFFNLNKKDLHVHHIIPKRRKGLNSIHNLTTVCDKCHRLIELEPFDKEPMKYVKLKKSTYKNMLLIADSKNISIEDVITPYLDRIIDEIMYVRSHGVMADIPNSKAIDVAMKNMGLPML
jgi:hypothetical protein